MFERSESSLERIILAPLQDTPEAPEDRSKSPEEEEEVEPTPQGLLRLNFVFKTPPTSQQVQNFAKALKRIWWNDKMPIDRIVWGGLSSWGGRHPSENSSTGVIKAANAFKERLRKRHSTEGDNPEAASTLVSQSSVSTPGLQGFSGAVSPRLGDDIPTPRSQSPGSSSDVQQARELSRSRKRLRRS